MDAGMIAGIAGILGVGAGAAFAFCLHDSEISFDRTIEDQARELPPIIRGARNIVRVATDLDPRLYEGGPIQEAFEEAIGNGAQVRILTDQEPLDWYATKAGIEIRKVASLPKHVLIVDGMHIRLERPHPPRRFGDNQGDCAVVLRGFSRTGKTLSREFDRLWTSTAK